MAFKIYAVKTGKDMQEILKNYINELLSSEKPKEQK